MNQRGLFDPPPIPTVLEEVKARVNDAMDRASPEQQEVLAVLRLSAAKVTQREIARRCPLLGAHWRDGSLKEEETTLRKVRQVIRDLRVEARVPILSDPGGYWLPRSKEEVDEYIDRVAKQARATAAAWFETLRTMEAFAQSTQQKRLFGAISALAEEFPKGGER